MQVYANNYSRQTFGAEVSGPFVDFMRSYINRKGNRLQNNFMINEKINEFKNFGYSDYTVGLYHKPIGYGTQYAMVALKKDSSLKEGIVIHKNISIKPLIEKFLNISVGEFASKMRRGEKYRP